MKIRGKKKADARLASRQADFDALSPTDQRGRKRPGSRNPHKGVGGGKTVKKGRRR